MTDRRPTALDRLGEEFHRLGEPAASRRPALPWTGVRTSVVGTSRHHTGSPHAVLATRRRPGFPRTAILAIVVVLVLAGAAAAAILISQGAPLPAPSAIDLSASGVPLPGTAQLAGLDAPDPDPSAPPWDVRLSRTAAGETCTAVGQVLGGQFGIVGLDHVFRALPLGGVDACGIASADGPVLAGARVFVGTGSDDARTVVNGVAGAGARSVTAYGPDGARPLKLGPDGSFITVYSGYVEDVRPYIVVMTGDGHSHKVEFASSSPFEVADPDGGSPWQVSGDPALQPGSHADEDCAQASQQLGRSDPAISDASLTPEVCGRLGSQPLFASIRRFVPDSGGHSGFPWGDNPARTLVYGAAAPRVSSLVLTGAGSPRTLRINPHGGVFLAVLDGHVDPRSLTLTARLAGGRTLTLRHSTELLDADDGRPLPAPPVPAYRNPLPPAQTGPTPFALPTAGTVRETLSAGDPAGGPDWVVRSWRATPNPKANFRGQTPPPEFYCSQFGVVEHGTLVDPGPGSSSRPLSLSSEPTTGGCDDTKSLERFGPSTEVWNYLQDPFAYSPTVLRTVVSGVLPPGASHPVLLGAGSPRRLPTDGNGAFLAVLPGRYWDAPLHLSAVIGGRRVTHAAGPPSFLGGVTPDAPQGRAPDPNGGAPWGFAADAHGSSGYGRIVDGRLAGIDTLTGTLTDGPEETTGGRGGGGAPSQQVVFDVQSGPLQLFPQDVAPVLNTPEIQRRTLPGQTIITGTAEADVTAVTLVTPRDVRTLRPSGPQHVFIVVYDGQFFSGELTASIHLRDGQTVVERIDAGPDTISPVQAAPSLATILRGTEQSLARLERGRGVPRPGLGPANPRSSADARRRAVSDLTRVVAAVKARIAYEAAHPGRLPAA